MQKFYAGTLTTITWQLNSLWVTIGRPDSSAEIAKTMQYLKRETDQLGWVDLSAQIDRFLRGLSSGGLDPDNFEVMKTLFNELLGNIQHHLTRDLFLCIQNPKIEYLLRPRGIFGDQVFESFPSASYDLLESSSCFALDRWTATVFHLMRAVESPLSLLAATFGVSLERTTWGPAIEQTESKIRNMHADPAWRAMPDWKEQQAFYAQAASHMGVLKEAWRDYTAHRHGKYDEREATDILSGVRAFMQKLATRLHE